MTWIIILMILQLLVLIIGFSTLEYKLKKKLENDERMIERLDEIIKQSGKTR